MSDSSLEKKIVAAALKSRSAFARINAASDIAEGYTPYSCMLLKLIERWYDRDDKAERVDADIVAEWIKSDLPEKQSQLYLNYLKECSGLDVSAVNVADIVVEQKRKHVGNLLAQALIDNDSNDIEKYKTEYDSLYEAEEDEEEEYNNVSIRDSMEQAADESLRIRLLPKALDVACKSKTKRGHHILVYARPETGKTALTLTLAYGLAVQGLSVIIFGNEEPVGDTILRAQCCFTGMTEEQIAADPDRAQALLDRRGWRNVRFIPINPGTPAILDRYLTRYKPDAFITDQIRNLAVRADTRVNQLEAAATTQRNLAKKHNALAISVTQAGDSADEKIFLDMGDVDFSNTGIPAAVDLMIGLGVTKQHEAQGIRGISLPKNKIGGIHQQFLTRINTQISRLEDV